MYEKSQMRREKRVVKTIVLILLNIIALLTIQSCTDKRLDIPIDSVYSKSAWFENIRDKNGIEYPISAVNNIFEYGPDSLLIVPEKDNRIYITNNNLEILEVISYEDQKERIREPVYSTCLYGKDLYFVDLTLKLKIFNLKKGEIEQLNNGYCGNNGLSVFNENIMVGTENNPQLVKGKNEKIICLGYIVRKRENDVIPVMTNENDYGDIKFLKGEIAFAAIYKEKIYIIFLVSKSVLIYDLEGKFLKREKVYVGDGYYQTPRIETEKGRETIIVSGLTMQPLRYYEGYLSQLVNEKVGNEVWLICYDENMTPVKKVLMKNTNKPGGTYFSKYWHCNGNIYVTNDFNGITIFKKD